MLEAVDYELCNGCQACANSCSQNAIHMIPDDEGFLRPQVDNNKCVDCGLCEKKCPLIYPIQEQRNSTAYAAFNKDELIRSQSSSGGLFYLLAAVIIRQGGAVFGAKFDSDFTVKHDYTESIDGLAVFLGSKYVQSNIGMSYRQAENVLKQGRPVLFTGTPCQIGGLCAYLGKEYDNLYCQDIICHGVPSPLVWEKYVECREAFSASKTRRTFFRHKKHGWKTYSVLFEFINNTEYIQISSKDLYMRSYQRNLTLRPSCYNCTFKSVDRQADITLADFWGIEKLKPDMNDDGGTSLIIVHTKKGNRLFDSVRDSIRYEQVDLKEAISYNSAMTSSVSANPKRGAFLKEIALRPFDIVARKYCEDSILIRCRKSIKCIIRKIQITKGE